MMDPGLKGSSNLFWCVYTHTCSWLIAWALIGVRRSNKPGERAGGRRIYWYAEIIKRLVVLSYLYSSSGSFFPRSCNKAASIMDLFMAEHHLHTIRMHCFTREGVLKRFELKTMHVHFISLQFHFANCRMHISTFEAIMDKVFCKVYFIHHR